jgi:ubiquinone/menaquinone biosynthesis C-methylase UbiE
MSEWFKEWFETPYYDQLYEHRDTEEARDFISKLLASLNIGNYSKVLDVACGNGRHAQALEQFGFP